MTKNVFTEEQKATVRQMRLDGLSASLIAKSVGRSEASIRHLVRRLGMIGVGGVKKYHRNSRPALPCKDDWEQRVADKAFVRALAQAFVRGDHLPAQRLAA